MVLVVPLFERQAAGRLPEFGRGHRRRRQRCSGCIARCTSPTTRSSTRSYYFTPGDRGHGSAGGFRVWKTRYATIGVLICWDQWYPGGRADHRACWARRSSSTRPPSAGTRPRRPSGVSRRSTRGGPMQRAHAIANGVYVASPNRIGHEDEPGTDGITFFGHSFIADPFGRIRRRGRRAAKTILDRAAATRRSSRTRAATGRSCATAASTPTARSSSAISADDHADSSPRWRMPAEWEPHRATWISWPHHEPDWPGKLGADSVGLRRDRARDRRRTNRSRSCATRADVRERRARSLARATACAWIACGCTSCPTDRVWLRDSAPTGVVDESRARVLAQLGVQRAGRKCDNCAARRRRSAARSRGIAPDCRASSRCATAGSARGARRRRHRGQRRAACCSSPRSGC